MVAQWAPHPPLIQGYPYPQPDQQPYTSPPQYPAEQNPPQQNPTQQYPSQQNPIQQYQSQQNPIQQYLTLQYPTQQYVPQPMPPQAMPPQPYSYPQQGPYQQSYYQAPGHGTAPPVIPYQQPYHQPPSQEQVPQVAQPTPPTCYNCGSPEHWAQHCPEPRRELPAGDLHRATPDRPIKRQKFNAPVITKYAVPQPPQQPYGPPSYGAQPYVQPSYAVYQHSYSPPTPISTHSPHHPQWPPASQQSYQQYQQPYTQGNPYPQQHYPVPPSPAASTPYGVQYQNSVSAQGPQQHGGYFPPQNQFQPNHTFQNQPLPSASPSVARPPPIANQAGPQQNYAKANPDGARHSSSDRSISMRSVSVTPRPHSATISVYQPEEDDLELLHIPDAPKYPGPNGELKPRPVGFALPADYNVFESVGGILPPPAFEAGGCLQSVFVTQSGLDSLSEKFTDFAAGDVSADDPIFLEVREDGEIITIEEWIGSRGIKVAQDLESELDREDGEWTQENEMDIESSSEESVDASIPNKPSTYYRSSIVSPKISQPYLGSSTLEPGAEKVPDSARDTEDILAALGVTGAPKPVRAPARPYPPPESSRRAQKTAVGRVQRSRSQSPRDHDHTNGTSSQHSNSAVEEHRPGTPGSISYHDPFDPEDRDPTDQIRAIEAPIPMDREGNVAYGEFPRRFHPPPPPPLPKRKSSTLDGAQDSPTSPGSSHAHNGFAVYNPDHTNAYNGFPADGKPYSPVKIRSERVVVRKREYDTRDSSDDEQGKERKRQIDDVTPKLKRRQPKVAAAYSRRW